MKKQMLPIAAILTATMLAAGCGAQAAPAPQPAETEATETAAVETEEQEAAETEEATEEEVTEDEVTVEYNDPDGLPTYTYTGTEEYLDVISDYMVTEYAKNFPQKMNVFIPYSIVVDTDDSNTDDILVYGEFDIDGYDLRNSTLVSNCGSRNAGIFHLQKADDGTVTVVKAELPETEDETEKLFSSAKDAYDKIKALTDEDLTEARAAAIADYVNTNGLHIDQWQDYGEAPVVVINAPEPPEEEEIYTFESPKGYGITYDLREFTLGTSDETDMYGKVEENEKYTGTFLVIEKVASTDTDAAMKEAMKQAGVTDAEITDATIGDGVACSTAQWQETLDDGRIFYYICYCVPMDDDVLRIRLETTYQEGVNEVTMDDLARMFAPMMDTFHLD